MIAQASINEKGKTTGGNPGNQSGKELNIKAYYSKPWDYALMYKNEYIMNEASLIAVKLVKCGLVGYGQDKRNTLYKELKKVDFDVDKYIKTGIKTECDCSSFVYCCYACLIPEMRTDNNAPTTRTIKNYFLKYGFYTAKASEHFKNGVIYNKEGSHVVISCCYKLKDYNIPDGVPIIRKGARGKNVEALQFYINKFGYNLEIDGDFGTLTEKALKTIQKDNKLESDGEYGPLTRKLFLSKFS